MIRYDISYDELANRITEHKASWLRRARERTETFIEKKKYTESSSIWSEIKSVYMDLQHNKCAFCERQLEGTEVGLIEQDVEHFRPKKMIKPWKVTVEDIQFTPTPAKGGYYKLPYHLFNYTASCKPCNSTLKRNYFPVDGSYNLKGAEPSALNTNERPYLIYPISDIDTDPAELIKFNGISPYAASAVRHLKNRALVTIEFFKLDDPVKRKSLLKERALIILALWGVLNSDDVNAQSAVNKFKSNASPHANCARCFIDLFETNQGQAEVFYQGVLSYFLTSS